MLKVAVVISGLTIIEHLNGMEQLFQPRKLCDALNAGINVQSWSFRGVFLKVDRIEMLKMTR